MSELLEKPPVHHVALPGELDNKGGINKLQGTELKSHFMQEVLKGGLMT